MNKIILSFLFLCGCSASGQVAKSIVKAQAFVTVHSAGTVMVDENGNELPRASTKVYTASLETKGTKPQWTAAWVEGKMYSLVDSKPASNNTFVVGKKLDGTPVRMSATKGNDLTLLELAPAVMSQQPPKSVPTNGMLLKGTLNGKAITFTIPQITELASPEYQ